MPFGLHFICLGWPWTSSWRPWVHPGHGLAPELAWRPRHGLDCIQARVRALFYSDPGIHAPVKVGGDLSLSDLTINLTTVRPDDSKSNN